MKKNSAAKDRAAATRPVDYCCYREDRLHNMLNRYLDSRSFKIRHYRILFPLPGVLIGYLILHPYTMLVYTVNHTGEVHSPQFQGSQFHRFREQALTAFHPDMILNNCLFFYLQKSCIDSHDHRAQTH